VNNDLKGKKVAIVGGAGFIGHNLALTLKDQGAEVFVIDGLSVNNLLYLHSTDQEIPGNRELYINMINNRLELLQKAEIPLHVEDARNYNELSHELSKIKPHVIILLAAVSHANRSNKNPFDTFDHSLRTLENALDYARGNVDRFIYFSSSMVYGNFPSEGVTEDTPCKPMGIYGNLKWSGEQMVRAYNEVFDLPYTIVRPSALYGERCISRRVGQIFIENALKGDDITVTGDGNDHLDFTYIKDLAMGVGKIIKSENAVNETFNLTYGESRSIGDMAQIIKEHFSGIKINYVPKDKLTPDRGTLLVNKAKRLIGYDPKHPLEEGYVEYINWYKSAWEKLNS